MQNNVLLTPVDELVNYVRKNPNSSIKSLTENLKISQEILERWLVILDEYKVLSVKYKGFEGFVNISGSYEKKTEEIDIDNLKSAFVSKCRVKGMDFKEMEKVWPSFLLRYEGDIKLLFDIKAKKRGYDKNKISKAWERYRQDLQRL